MTVLFLIYAVHSYLTYEFTINEAKKITLLRSEAQANNIMQDLDKYINNRMLEIQELTEVDQIQLSVKESNEYFADPELLELVSQFDKTGGPNEITPFLDQITDSEISDELQRFISAYKNEYNYDVVRELFITNQYGVNIALATGKSDYLQSDEEWWQITQKKQNYVGKIAYDQNYDEYVVPFAFPILDESANHIGTLRMTLSSRVLFHDFLNDVDVLQEAKKTVILVSDDGKIVYEDGMFFPQNPPKGYFSKMTADNGSFEVESPETSLVSYASSIGYRDFSGFGWTVIIEQKSSVIDEFEVLERNFLISTVIGIISASVLGFVLSSFVTKPLEKLSKLTILLGKGDFDAKIQKSSVTEINSIMNSFKEMEVSLKKLFETEKSLAEANVRIKNERLTAIGELAASMAHDMKNPLGTIRTGMDIIKRNVDDKQEMNEVIRRMDRAVSRMSHQVEDVLNYVRKTPLSIRPVQIKSIIKSAIDSLDIPSTIQITTEGDDIMVRCDEKKIEVVLINLILNSIQAIEQDNGTINIKIRKQNKNIVIDVQDSGPGIPDKMTGEIFKPLVTTKQKGTGLGLASCKNIIEQHGGTISFRNDPSTFTITIPIEQDIQ